MSYKIDRLGSKRNYKHVGRVQRRVMRAFIIRPEWSTSALMEWAYPRQLLLQGRTSYHHRVITAGRSVEPLRSYGSGAAPRDQVGRFCGGSRHSSEVKVARHIVSRSVEPPNRLAITPRLEAGPGTKKSPTEAGLKL